jgi:hypothetical protein
VATTVGSYIILECTVSGSSYQWQNKLNTYWSNAFQEGSKYGNVNTTLLTIYDINTNDAGTYRCTAGSQQMQINLIVIGMYGRQDKYISMTTTTRRLISDICVNFSS